MSTKELSPGPREYFTIPEAASKMRLSVPKIKEEISAGRLRAKNTSPTGERGKTVISSEALDAWFDGLADA